MHIFSFVEHPEGCKYSSNERPTVKFFFFGGGGGNPDTPMFVLRQEKH